MDFILLTLILFNLTHLSHSTTEKETIIRVTKFQVPNIAKVGETVRLKCDYELNGETLHAMKLFKDDKEFYRYQPVERREDQKMAFSDLGIQVDLVRSNEKEAIIKNINKNSAGLYKCQVSIENTFKSISAIKRMEVRDRMLPESLMNTYGTNTNHKRKSSIVHQHNQVRSNHLAGKSPEYMPIQESPQTASSASTVRNFSLNVSLKTVSIVQLVFFISSFLVLHTHT